MITTAPAGLVDERPAAAAPLLQTSGLTKHFHLAHGVTLRAVEQVSLSVARSETLALVGESGSGKTTLGRTIVRLYRPTAGSIVLEGQEISRLEGKELRRARARARLVFQASSTAFDPRLTISASIDEALRAEGGSKRERQARAGELLAECGLRPLLLNRYPHELSGGQCQRAAIARALASRPSLVVADEPTASLDLSTQAQIVNLLLGLQEREHLAMLFITHDIDLARHLAHRLAVMYLGRIVEVAAADELLDRPMHPYSAALVSSSNLHSRRGGRRILLSGEVPSPVDPPSGCAFRTRCPAATARCAEEVPALTALDGEPATNASGARELAGAHLVACHFAGSVKL